MLAPYHASRDCRVWWERDRRIKCPRSHACVRRRAASLRSRHVDSYELVSVFDGCYSVEPQSIRTTLFPCSRLWTSSCLDNRTCDRGVSSRGPRFMYGCSRYVHQLGYPLLIPSTQLHLPKTLSNAKMVYILSVDFDEWNNIGIHDFSIRDHLWFRNRCVAMNSFKIQN